MRVIVNADDLGASESVNDAIFELMAQRRVTSATLLANGPCASEAATQASRFPNCSFGIHLNVTEFRPLRADMRLAPLLDDAGFFNGYLNKAPRRVRPNWALASAVAYEWSRQIELIRSWGIQISHIDSHHHVHTLPFLFLPLKWLQAKYKLRKVRISKNMFLPNHNISKSRMAAKGAYNYLLRNIYTTKTVAAFTDLRTFVVKAGMGDLGCDTVEVMVHPGQTGNKQEASLLRSPWWESVPVSTKLINYHSL